MWGNNYEFFESKIQFYSSNSYTKTQIFTGGDDYNLFYDYKSDVKLFNFWGYMGVNPYTFAKGSVFHFSVDGAGIFKGVILGLIFLFFI